MYSVCWGGCDQSLEWIKARSSLHSKSSVITPLWIHSGFYIPAHGKTAPCSLHLNVIRENWGETKYVAHCCCSAVTTKIIPASAAASHCISQLGSNLAENTEQNLNFGAGLQLLIINILIPAGSNRIYHICMCFWVLRTHSRALIFCVPTDRGTAFNNYKGSLQMWYIDLIQQINKQILHDFALSSTKIVPNKVTAEPLCISKSKFIFKTLMSTLIYSFNCTHATSEPH